MSLDDSLHLATADALHSNHLERARILLAIALRAEISDEEARLSAALAGGRARPTTINRKLAPLLPLWQKEQPERAPGVEKLASGLTANASLVELDLRENEADAAAAAKALEAAAFAHFSLRRVLCFF